MDHYRANLRDIEFNLFEALQRQELLGHAPFQDMDLETARDILRQVTRLAEHELAESLLESDRVPPTFDPDTHSATLPEAFKMSYKAYTDAEWWRLDLPEHMGGIPVPRSIRWAIAELVLGANPSVHIYSAGYAFAAILEALGNADQKRIAQLMVDNHWGSTMVLTEPDAGSDVGAGRTRAVQQPDGTWHLTGVKRFITTGDADLFDNIVHLVLARPAGAGPGTKGLSLFVVPKFQIDLETGELGERNGAFVTNVEHKMGLKVSTTCEVAFGEVAGIPAVGTLVGDTHDGIAQMFRIIEFARMMVGTKAMATLSTGYLNALEYAKERVQGADLMQSGDKSAARVRITQHPDVRRSLMLQKAYSEGLRALVLFTAAQQDTLQVAEQPADHSEHFTSGSPEDIAGRVNDLLLPIVKGLSSERAWVLLGSESLQTLGGSGFLQDYPIEQYVRDAKIDTLYEGTTAIQGQDFFFRKILRDRGVALGWLVDQIQTTATPAGDYDPLAAERQLLGTALKDVNGIVAFLTSRANGAHAAGGDPRDVYIVGQNTTRLLLAAGDLVVGWLLLRQADVATTALTQNPSSKDTSFYKGKIAAAKFYARNVLPTLTAQRVMAQATDNDLMDLDESAF